MAETPAIRFPTDDEVEGLWTWDKIHAPRPLTPLSSDIVTSALAEGFTRAQRAFYCSVGLAFRAVNYYAYARFYPLEYPGLAPEERRERYRQTTLTTIVPHVGRLWREEWLPSIEPGLARARETDYASLDDASLVSLIDELQEEHVHRWEVHGKINFVLVAASWFTDFYDEVFAPADKAEAYECLQGFDTLSVQAGRDLWRLSRIVRADRTLRTAFEAADALEIVPRLQESPSGRRFLTDFRDYLDRWGWRSDAIFELADSTWRERPVIPLNTLQGYIRLGDDSDPDNGFRRSVERREALLAKARAQLAGAPEKLRRFESLYEAAKDNLVVTEDHNYYIDQMGVAVLRLPFLECGRRMAFRGQLAAPEDVFCLRFDEVKDGIVSGESLQGIVAERKAGLAAAAKVVPPATLGRPERLDREDPFISAMGGKMLGLVDPIEPSRDPDVINGVPASPGTVQGVAKVVRRLEEASKLQRGDIMVCEMTVPPWTPLFSTVSGLVADTGGILSHCAIVAREHRLPAVVGTVVGTQRIKDGMVITVDGTKGIVRIDSRG
ncbi:MAG TPA: PEP-utilizing enzyme [Dehalococcoidia bacterium]|nr:PEP-utilizing enzyme [Dehalococcoidia bacterium]